eukprot:14895347-Heterocapsa_arctica.AAC.1
MAGAAPRPVRRAPGRCRDPAGGYPGARWGWTRRGSWRVDSQAGGSEGGRKTSGIQWRRQGL